MHIFKKICPREPICQDRQKSQHLGCASLHSPQPRSWKSLPAPRLGRHAISLLYAGNPRWRIDQRSTTLTLLP